jgi:voltage-gated potassium channel
LFVRRVCVLEPAGKGETSQPSMCRGQREDASRAETLITWARRAVAGDIHKLGPFRSAALVVRVTTRVIALHGLQVLVWAGCYRWLCLPSWDSALYFSATSYTTVGYGDIILPSKWRMLGPIEGILGILMCGLSVSLLFAIATRLVGNER